MEKRAQSNVFQDRTNSLSSRSFRQESLVLTAQPRTAYDTKIPSLMETTPHASMKPGNGRIGTDEAQSLLVPPLVNVQASLKHGLTPSVQRPSVRALRSRFEQAVAKDPAPPTPPPPPPPPKPTFLRNEELPKSSPRAIRYQEAEKALAETAQQAMESDTSVRNLQIVALKRATSLLNAHIVDAKQQVEKLRPLLATREADPLVYRSMQRQRWMEERRQYAAEQLTKALEKHVATLASQPAPPISTRPSKAKPDTAGNLERFLDSSRNRVQVRNRNRRRTIAPREEKKVPFPHVHHHRHLLSLKLKPNPPLSFLRKPSEPMESHEGTVDKDKIPIDPSESPVAIQHEKDTTADYLTPIGSPESQIPLTPLPEGFEKSPVHAGTATIWYSTAPRTAEEIVSGLVVAMPEYVTDLLAGFDLPDAPPLAPVPAPAPAHPPSTPKSSKSAPPATAAPTPPAVQGPPPALRRSASRRRISAILGLPEAISSRIGFEARAAGSKRFSTPPPSSFPARIYAHDAAGAIAIAEEAAGSRRASGVAAAERLGGRISFSASHLPDVTRAGAEVGASASQSALGGGNGNIKLVARLKRRLSVLRSKV